MVFIRHLHSSKKKSEKEEALDFEEMKKADPIKEVDDKIVFGLKDDLDYSKLDMVLEKLSREKRKVFVIHNGNKLFRVERYLLKLLRTLKSNKVDFSVVGVPLCYVQEFLDYSYDLERFLFNMEDFSNYHYYEDCRFCRLRKICPGALPKYENQVFASFKEHFEAVDYSKFKPKVYKVKKDVRKLKELFKRDELVNLKLNEQRILLKNRDDEIINELFSGFAAEKKDKDVFDTELKVDFEHVERLSDRKKYSYRTADKERTGKKFLSFLVDVELAEQIVLFSHTCVSREIIDWLRPDLIGLVESRDYSSLELLKLLSHKITLFIKSDNDFYYISRDLAALEKATNEGIEAGQIYNDGLGNISFEIEEV